jgi:hypothetical protein
VQTKKHKKQNKMSCIDTLAKAFFTVPAIVFMFAAFTITWSGVALIAIVMFVSGALTCIFKDTISWVVYFWTGDEKENPSNRLNKAMEIFEFIFKIVRRTNENDTPHALPLIHQ